MSISYTDGNTSIDRVQKNYKYGNQMYTATYILPKVIECKDEVGDYIPCDYQRDPIEIYGLNTADVVRIYIRSYL